MGKTLNTNDTDLRLNIVQIESDLKHLTQEVGKIAEAINAMADMRAELREVQGHISGVIGSHHTRIDDLKKDVDCLGAKLRTVDDALHKLQQQQAVTSSKIGAGERFWWIVVTAVVVVVSQFFKLSV